MGDAGQRRIGVGNPMDPDVSARSNQASLVSSNTVKQGLAVNQGAGRRIREVSPVAFPAFPDILEPKGALRR
jgi:hypothetical protein